MTILIATMNQQMILIKSLISVLYTDQNTATLTPVKEQISNIINSESFNNTQHQVEQYLKKVLTSSNQKVSIKA